MNISPNIGLWDRIIRITLGLTLIGLAYFGIVGVWGYIGVIPLVTGLIKWCPIYSILGIQTCPAHNTIKHT
ncbi:YgaP family membrane protein [Thiomicrorhabdus arctica]|jgi:hypothetical protein|uniref:YgaP family membrane protein n=1 Tax=Thiomicrorhabdus arctica TaxID=131540 RepID=UPI00035CA648|nr:DUF2892 domain-containing protein [Thiomicrorhabdus arctica]